MAATIPMVRALGLLPAVNWLRSNGQSPQKFLREVGLESAPYGNPMRPVSLFQVARLLRVIADFAGPDVPWRIVEATSTLELGVLGRVVLGTQTPTEGIRRISSALPFFCSHEQLWIASEGDHIELRHAYGVRFEPVTEHLMLQYAVAMTDRLCSLTGASAPRISEVHIPPHPEHKFEHLRPYLGDRVRASTGRSIRLTIPREVADRPFQRPARDRMLWKRPMDMQPLRGDGTFRASAAVILESMLEDGVPSVHQLATVAGTSARTLQRRLQDEDTSFSLLLNEVRRNVALRQLAEGEVTAGSISSDLGYAHPGSLTRAMIRWTGLPPSRIRRNASAKG